MARLTKNSIVAVHGLNPKNKDSHAEKTWTAGGKLWLSDFLAPKLPEARILLFGYNSNVASDVNAMHIGDHATNLLNRLEHKRTEDPKRPIVFVAHSLGGLVVKKVCQTGPLWLMRNDSAETLSIGIGRSKIKQEL